MSVYSLKRVRESASANHVAGTRYSRYFEKIIEEDCFSHQVFNLDKTSLFWNKGPAYTFHIQE
jgi:hypothetical protein